MGNVTPYRTPAPVPPVEDEPLFQTLTGKTLDSPPCPICCPEFLPGRGFGKSEAAANVCAQCKLKHQRKQG